MTRFRADEALEWDAFVAAAESTGAVIVRVIYSVRPNRSPRQPGTDAELRSDLVRDLGATRVPSEAVVMLSADLQHDPDDPDDAYFSETVVELPAPAGPFTIVV